MFKAYKFRLCPNHLMKTKLNQNIGSALFIYNYYLDKKDKLYKSNGVNLSLKDMKKQLVELQDEYKCRFKGKKLIKVESYYASSQICNRCGAKNQEIKNLNIRKWECKKCGSKNDRDINASINILEKGLIKYYKGEYGN